MKTKREIQVLIDVFSDNYNNPKTEFEEKLAAKYQMNILKWVLTESKVKQDAFSAWKCKCCGEILVDNPKGNWCYLCKYESGFYEVEVDENLEEVEKCLE